MDEFIKVIFTTRRKVFVDGNPAGFTNKMFQVETGQHKFDLGPEKDYTPVEQIIDVVGTTPLDPMIIHFTDEKEES